MQTQPIARTEKSPMRSKKLKESFLVSEKNQIKEIPPFNWPNSIGDQLSPCLFGVVTCKEDLTALGVPWFPGMKLEPHPRHTSTGSRTTTTKKKLGLAMKDEPGKPNGLHGKAREKPSRSPLSCFSPETAGTFSTVARVSSQRSPNRIHSHWSLRWNSLPSLAHSCWD